MKETPVSCLTSLSEERREDFWASLALRYTKGIGFRTAKRLLVEYGSASAAMKDIKGWSSRASVSARVVQAVLGNGWRETARKEWDHAAQVACDVLLWSDSAYPDLLREIPDPPLFLYYKGDASLLKNPSIGVVGSRRCSQEGIETTKILSKTLSASGVTTVSGLARGIDSVAHTNALTAWGSTVAVLGTGISHVYPPENRDLFFDVAENGIIVTEFPPNMPPEGRNFPLRNRIISGLSLGVLVVEATPKSGSLITARHALEQGREVFAVPGRMQSRTSSGCHDLIRQGATAVFSCDDILVSIAPLLGISLDGLNRTKDIGVVASSAQPSAVEPVPVLAAEKVSETVVSVGEVSSVSQASNAEAVLCTSDGGSNEIESLGLPNSSRQCEGDKSCEASALISEIELHSEGFSSEEEQGNPESFTDAVERELSIEEQLQAIPEVIEIPITAHLSGTAPNADCSVGCTGESAGSSLLAEAISSTESRQLGHTIMQESAPVAPSVRVYADILPLEEKVVDSSLPLEEQIVLLLAGEESVHIDVLSRMLHVSASQISTALLMLEVSGLVRQLPGMKYTKI
ncbi:DNA-processing protein DprA [Halodesulfovibrio sp.]|jgi:DNA protecting protein DprA|uniref:DNA-processing protein DprA n=1 Tax=Halodesulfovibrio sp. TaxID=1912772 RepID=UPI0025D942FC|nr:DNA-processing protein DprA [Halodesulfovibrio sp.]MCT4534211.1 DNA-processing protein DprA [Halodesulfovibrio sp.]MCT4627312.1 DNA-processing protein DprA [Halodesulfovibrio sp.]